MSGINNKSTKDLLNTFFNESISKEDTIFLMNSSNRKIITNFIEHQKARLLIERMSQIWEDKEYVFAVKVLWRLQSDLAGIFPTVKEYKADKKKEEDEEKEKQKRQS